MGGVSARNWQEMAEGNYNHHYRLRLGNNVFHFILKLGHGSVAFSEVPFVIVWDSIVRYSPSDLHGYDYDEIIKILKKHYLHGAEAIVITLNGIRFL